MKKIMYLLIVLVALTQAFAQQAVTLTLNHKDMVSDVVKMKLERDGIEKTQKYCLGKPVEIALKNGECLVIIVEEPNHLLYQYDFEQMPQRKTENAMEFDKLLSALIKFKEEFSKKKEDIEDPSVKSGSADNTKGTSAVDTKPNHVAGDNSNDSKGGGGERKSIIYTGNIEVTDKNVLQMYVEYIKEGANFAITLDDLIKKVGSLAKLVQEYDKNPEELKKEVNEWDLDELSATIEKVYNDYSKVVDVMSSENYDRTLEYSKLKDEKIKLRNEIDELESDIKKFEGDVERKKEQKIELANMKDEEISEAVMNERLIDLDREIKDLNEKKGNAKIDQKLKEDEITKINLYKKGHEELAYYGSFLAQASVLLTIMVRERPTLDEALKKLNSFQKDVAAYGTPKTHKFRINYNGQNIQTVVLEISKTETYGKNYDAKRSTGKIVINIVPFSRWVFTAGAAAIYSFVKAPTFSAVPVPNTGTQTGFIIEKEEEDYKEYAVSALLQMTPKKWAYDDLAVSLDLGASVENKNVGLLLGGSMKLNRTRAGIGLGVIMQRVDELDESLHVGDPIASTDDLIIKQRYATGAYLAINVKIGK